MFGTPDISSKSTQGTHRQCDSSVNGGFGTLKRFNPCVLLDFWKPAELQHRCHFLVTFMGQIELYVKTFITV
jgi:hypothetical protein